MSEHARAALANLLLSDTVFCFVTKLLFLHAEQSVHHSSRTRRSDARADVVLSRLGPRPALAHDGFVFAAARPPVNLACAKHGYWVRHFSAAGVCHPEPDRRRGGVAVEEPGLVQERVHTDNTWLIASVRKRKRGRREINLPVRSRSGFTFPVASDVQRHNV